MRGMSRGNPQKRGQSEAGSDGLSNTQLRATPVAVSASSLPLATGAATAAKQPAIGTAGTPASDILTVQGIASMTAIKIDGSGVTQPVSGTVTVTGIATETTLAALSTKTPALGQATMANSSPVVIASNQSAIPVSGPLTDAQLRASVVPVSLASTTITGSVAVTIAALPALVAGSALIGKVGIDQTTPGTTNAFSCAYIGSTAIATGNGVVGAGVQRVAIASDNSPISVTQPTLTKGTQGSTGLSTQDLKDAGRTVLAMTAEFTFAQTTETLLTMTLSANGAATSTFTSRTITSGKKFRIYSALLEIELLGSGTAPQRAYLRMRVNTAGATTTASPLQWILPATVSTAIVKAAGCSQMQFPDGFEIGGDGTATFGFTLETPDWVTTTATGRAKLTIIGFEY